MVYIILVLIIILSCFIIIAIKDKINDSRMINKVAKVKDEMELWDSSRTKKILKKEKIFLSKFSNIQFEENGLCIEEMKKNCRVENKLFFNYNDILKVEKVYEGNNYLLNNGMKVFDEYYIDIHYTDGINRNKKRICLEKTENLSRLNPIDKIKYNTYIDIITEKINEVSDNQMLVN